MSTIVTRAGKGAPLTNTEVDANFTNLDTDKLEAGDALGTPASVTLTNATGLPTAGLVDNAVTNPKLRDSAGLSVIGRGANSTGDPADIVAGTNKQVLRRDGSSLAFGAVDLSSNQAVTGTLPVNQGGTGITSFGTGVAAFLGTPSSANLAAAVTNETGTGALVFATSPTLVTPALGTPASGVATNLTGLPLSTGVTGTLPVANGGTGLTSYTANGVVFASGTGTLATSAELQFDGTKFAIGVAASASFNYGVPSLSVASNSFIAAHLAAHANAAINGSYFGLMRSRGTQASPTYCQTGDLIGDISAQPLQDASSSFPYLSSGFVRFQASGTHSASSLPTDLLFGVTAASSITPSEQMRLTSTGLGIGTSSPAAKLHVRPGTDANLRFSDDSGVRMQAMDDAASVINQLKIGGNPLIFLGSGGSETARIDSSGRFLLGTTASRGNNFNITNQDFRLQVEGPDYLTSGASFTANANNALFGPHIVLNRTRGTTVGSNTIVQNGDRLGLIGFQGNDGTGFVSAAFIDCAVDGTPDANNMPGRIVFMTTPNGSASPAERLRITSAGNVGIANTTPAVKLDVTGQIRASTGILFGSDTAAANALDDYEEGDWTIGLSDVSTAAAMEAGFTTGSYVKIGRQVTVSGSCYTSSVAGLSGAVFITGLPFTSGTGNKFRGAGATSTEQLLNITAGQKLSITVNANSTTLGLYISDSAGGGSQITAAEWSNDGFAQFTATYFTA